MKYSLIITCLSLTLSVFAQKDIKLIKINNVRYPKIELMLKFPEIPDTAKLKITEKNKPLDYVILNVPIKDLANYHNFLFLVNANEIADIKPLLQKEIVGLQNTDKINIGIMQNDKTGKTHIQYASPEFSGNFAFFDEFLNGQNLQGSFRINKNCKTTLKVQNYMFSGSSAINTTGIIMLGNFGNNELNFCSGLTSELLPAVYILQRGAIEKEKEDKLIALCMKKDGIYTQCNSDKEIGDIIRRYKEDMSSDVLPGKSMYKKIIFQLNDEKSENLITVRYGKYTKEISVFSPKRKSLSKNELFLIMLSPVLFILIIILLFLNKKNKKHAVKVADSPSKDTFVPIEISIKGKSMHKTFYLEKNIIGIGRASDNDIIIPDITVSANHAVIKRVAKEFFIEDLESTNGILINGKNVKKQALKSGENIKLGAVVMFIRF